MRWIGVRWFVALAVVTTSLGCDERIVFRDREVFNPPADAASGFLGYFNVSDKLTTCGNCHVESQSEWENTAHADAYATLDNSGHAQAFCYSCHTVNDFGNPISEAAGWNAVEDTSYHDVQCESCHGPGLTHVENPEGSQPFASLAIPATLDGGCAECHTGTHHPFAEEWAQSGHAAVLATPSTREACVPCHTGQGALAAWGVNADYVEKDGDPIPFTCGVCHDPHDPTNPGQLRLPVGAASVETNLCAQCHNRRSVPDPTSSHGLEPHAPQAALLLGEAGWHAPGSILEQTRIIGSHGSEGNERLCATCHIQSFEVTDAETGEFVFQATGHLFTAIPCLGPDGVPVIGDCALSTDERSFLGCTGSGCHDTEAVAAGILNAAVLDIGDRAEDLLALLEQVDANLEGAGGAIDPADPAFTVAEGAFYNYHLAFFRERFTGAAAHNPFLVRALLVSSAQAVEDEYGVAPPPGSPVRDYDAEIEAILERAAEYTRRHGGQ